MAGGLFDPLGTDRPEAKPRGPAAVVAAGCALAALATLLAVSYLRDDGDRGRPVVVVPIAHVDPPPAPPPPASPTPPGPSAAPAIPPPPGLPPTAADEDVEIQNGVRIVRPHRAAPGASGEVLAVPPASMGR